MKGLRYTIPSTVAVASSTGANALTATINAVADSSVLIFGIDIAYTATGSKQHVRVEDAGVIAWSQFVADLRSFDFPEPLIMTKNTSAQVIADQPGGTANGRLSVRYALERA